MLKRLALVVASGYFLLAGAPALRAQAPAAAPDNWDTRLSEAKGDVKVYLPGEAKPAAAEKDMPLEEGDRIVTGDDSSADLTLDGGTVVHLSEKTDFTLANVKRSQTALKLSLGTFLAKVQKLLTSQSLLVQTPTAIAAVRGTEFGVEVDPEKPDESHVGVFDEGKVEVKGQTGAAETLIGGQETKVEKGQAPLHAYQLQRFMKHRSFMRTAMKRRLQALRRSWKALAPEERQALRKKALARARERAAELEKKGKELKEKKDKEKARERRADSETKQKREKMEKFRESIRNRKK